MNNKMKKLLKSLINRILCLLPVKKIILFESNPCFTDNTKAVFDKMIERGINKDYKLIWVNYDKKPYFFDFENVKCISRFSKLFTLYYSYVAKAFVVCNLFIPKRREEQNYIYLMHGGALKRTHGSYSIPDYCDDCDIICLSGFFKELEKYNLSSKNNKILPLGYARTDELFSEKDIKQSISYDYKKIIYWLPTFRQHRFSDAVHSSVSFPILNNSLTAKAVNDYCAERNVLIVVKPHPAQDLSFIKNEDLSNIKFIDNEFLKDNGISNYEFLGSCDALLTDYSSVYYDFLLCDKPVGLCWDDFEEYKEREGFVVDTDSILDGGEKLYNSEDLCGFIERVANGIDSLSEKRNEIKSFVHDYADNNASERIVDYIMSRI